MDIFSILTQVCYSVCRSFFANEKSELHGAGKVPRAYTRAWCCSHNFENSVLFDFRLVAKDKDHAYDCLREEYGDTITGSEQVRSLIIRCVFADAETAEHALIDGVPCGKWRVMPTVVLDSSWRHTIIKIKHLPMEAPETTEYKLRQSLRFLDSNQPVRFIRIKSPTGDMYEGNVLAIIRGEYPVPRQRVMYLSEFMEMFSIELYEVPSYCHLCDSLDRHVPRRCPLLLEYVHHHTEPV